MAAADGVGAVAVGIVPLPAGPVPVTGDRLDVVKRIGIEVLSRLPLVPRSLDHVVEVRNHACRLERMAQIVEVHAPRITRALGKDLEDVPHRMVPPDAGVDPGAVGLGRARFADGGTREHAVAAVEPAVGAPDEGVERLVSVLRAPAVEQHRRFAVGHVVAIGVWNKHEVRGCAHPHASEPDRQTADEVEPLLEDLPGVENVVAIGILEDENPVTGILGCDLPRVGIAFRHPETAAVVEAHRDRLADFGLGREQFDREAGGPRHRPRRLQRREAIGHRHPPPRLRLRLLPFRERICCVRRIRGIGRGGTDHDKGDEPGSTVEAGTESRDWLHKGASCHTSSVWYDRIRGTPALDRVSHVLSPRVHDSLHPRVEKIHRGVSGVQPASGTLPRISFTIGNCHACHVVFGMGVWKGNGHSCGHVPADDRRTGGCR